RARQARSPMHIRPALLRFAAAAALWLLPAAAAAEAPTVVVSIKPVHSLVAAVMDGIAIPDVIVEGGASPHVYTLRPSQARTLARADLVVWVGPDYETFLSRPVEALADRAEVLALADLPSMTLYQARNGGAW